jgi:hypothetical protein
MTLITLSDKERTMWEAFAPSTTNAWELRIAQALLWLGGKRLRGCDSIFIQFLSGIKKHKIVIMIESFSS